MCSKESEGRKNTSIAVGCLVTSVLESSFIPVGWFVLLVPETKYLTRNKLRDEGFTL